MKILQKPRKSDNLAFMYVRFHVDEQGFSLHKSGDITYIYKIIDKKFKLDIINTFCDFVDAKGKPVDKRGFKKLVDCVAGQDYQFRFSYMFREENPQDPVSNLIIFDEVSQKDPARWEFLEYFDIKIRFLPIKYFN